MDIRIESADPREPESAGLIAALDALMTALYAPASNHLLPGDRLAEADIRFFLARANDRAVGCAALRVDAAGYGEVKRMYVDETARGHGLGRRLLERLEAEARAAGLTELRLETGARSGAAIALYRAAGFVDRGPFGDYWDDPASLYLEKRLG